MTPRTSCVRSRAWRGSTASASRTGDTRRTAGSLCRARSGLSTRTIFLVCLKRLRIEEARIEPPHRKSPTKGHRRAPESTWHITIVERTEAKIPARGRTGVFAPRYTPPSKARLGVRAPFWRASVSCPERPRRRRTTQIGGQFTLAAESRLPGSRGAPARSCRPLVEGTTGRLPARSKSIRLRACADRLATFHYLSVLRTIKWAPHHSFLLSLPPYPRSFFFTVILHPPRESGQIS